MPKNKWKDKAATTLFIPRNLSFILSERMETGTPNKSVTGMT